MNKTFLTLVAAALALAGCGEGPTGSGGGQGAARQQIRIVGSSTVYPFSRAVAERFAQANAGFAAPIVEFDRHRRRPAAILRRRRPQFPDVTNASRRIKASEIELCNRNGVARSSRSRSASTASL